MDKIQPHALAMTARSNRTMHTHKHSIDSPSRSSGVPMPESDPFFISPARRESTEIGDPRGNSFSCRRERRHTSNHYTAERIVLALQPVMRICILNTCAHYLPDSALRPPALFTIHGQSDADPSKLKTT